MKFKATIEVELDVEAKNKNIALKIIEIEKPHLKVCGADVKDGCYSIKTTGNVKVLTLKECE